ncbi:MAG UNVERIFIED_CONTAM: hypothetical protein LVR18_18600 [Planctomycetaceae bacterium]|jgi:hypothetical protein
MFPGGQLERPFCWRRVTVARRGGICRGLPAQLRAMDAVSRLPGIEQLQFFGLEDALAICGPDAEFGGATVFRTRDGGQTWQPLESDRPAAPWLVMGCFSAEEAVLGGMRQQAGTLVSGNWWFSRSRRERCGVSGESQWTATGADGLGEMAVLC